MSTIKKYQVCVEGNSVTLEVDTQILTTELAIAINSFWSGSKERLHAQGMDVVLAVVRLFGVNAICCMRDETAKDFDIHDIDASRYWTKRVLKVQEEGWPDADGLGIRIVAADLMPDFDYFDAELTEVDA